MYRNGEELLTVRMSVAVRVLSSCCSRIDEIVVAKNVYVFMLSGCQNADLSRNRWLTTSPMTFLSGENRARIHIASI